MDLKEKLALVYSVSSEAVFLINLFLVRMLAYLVSYISNVVPRSLQNSEGPLPF
jgi:hypothetical protein